MKSYLFNLLTTLIIVAIGGAILYEVLKPNNQKEVGKNIKTEDLVDFWNLFCWDLKIPQKYPNGFYIYFYVQKGKEKPIQIKEYTLRGLPEPKYFNRKLIFQCIGKQKYKFLVTSGSHIIFSPEKYFKDMHFLTLLNLEHPLEPNKIFAKFTNRGFVKVSPKLEDWECGLFYKIEPYIPPKINSPES
jgi:hypothetical protein